MNTRWMLGGMLAVASVMGATTALAVYAPQDNGAAALFKQRCASCHEGGDERAPSLADLKQRTTANVIDALTNGAMKPMAGGLSADQVRQLAEFVTAKPVAAPAAPAAAAPARGGQAAAPGGAGRGAAVAPGVQPADNMCTGPAPAIKTAATDWNGFGRDSNGSRFQKGTSLNAGNVANLRVKWSFAVAGGRYGQPTVVGDWLFLATGGGQAYALDAKSGCVRWRADIQSSRTSPYVVNAPGLSPSGWVAFVGNRDRDVIALDAMTGKQVWKTNIETHPRSVLTGSPVFYKGVLYQPTSSGEETIATVAEYGCCTFIGSVVALDGKTGKIKWKTPMLDGNHPTRKNSAGTQMFGPAGAAIWSQPTIDTKRNALYVATGDSYTETAAPRSDAIVALDLATGKIKWANQVTENDNFLVGCNPQRPAVNCPTGVVGPDHDFGASPIIQTVAGGKQVLLIGQKSSQVYGIDPDTGKKLWDIKLGSGSALGGVEWGMAADDKRLYVSNSDGGRPAPGNPSVTAIDPASGKTVWQFQPPRGLPCSLSRCSVAQSAPPSVIPGVVFAGGMDSWIRALASDTGKVLWAYEAGAATYQTTNGVKDQKAGSFDATGPVVSGGSMYIIAGYTGATGGIGYPVNVLLAFSVDGK